MLDGPDGDSSHVDRTSLFLPLFSLQVAASARQSASSHSPLTCPITPCPFQLEPLRSTCRCSSQSLQTELPLTSKCPLPPSLPYSFSFPLLDVLKLQLNLVPLPAPRRTRHDQLRLETPLVLLFADTTAALSQHSQSVKAPPSSFSTSSTQLSTGGVPQSQHHMCSTVPQAQQHRCARSSAAQVNTSQSGFF